jgi:uncharacterized membrane protein
MGMSKKLWSILVGAIVVIVLVGIQSLEHWTLVEHSIEGLKRQGPIGVFLAGVLVSPVLPLVLALGIIVIVIEVWRKQREITDRRERINRPSQELPSRADSRIENSGNSSATGGAATGGNAIVNQYFIGEKTGAYPPPPEAPKRKPNLRYRSVRTCPINITQDFPGAAGEFVVIEIDHDVGAWGIVACYRNTPATGVLMASDVSAHLTLRDAEGQEIGTGVSKACWLNNPTDTIDLEPGIPHDVVLLVTDKKNVSIPWKKWNLSTGQLDSDIYSVPRPVATVEVEIIDSRGEPLLPKSAFAISEKAGVLEAEIKLPS